MRISDWSSDVCSSDLKLIAEPWDIGMGGYQVGNFPAGWAEWNDRYRDTVRRFWKRDEGQTAELASRITGSSDLFDKKGRQIGRAECRERGVSTSRSRWSPYHQKKK